MDQNRVFTRTGLYQDRREGSDQLGNMTWRNGWGVVNAQFVYDPQHLNNRMTVNPITGATMGYDASGNLTSDGTQTFSYDATGQQTYASSPQLWQGYDGDTLRIKKTENSTTKYYLRSAVLGGQVVAEINASGGWTRGFVYLGGQMLAIQGGTGGQVSWVHQDPVTKSQRVTNSSGTVTSTIDLDPWGGETGRSSNQAFQPRRYTTYERDNNGGDEAMMRRYQSNWTRFSQPDPYDGSYDLTNPQSFNRYAYVQNDPVNFVDPSGLDADPGPPPDCGPGTVAMLDDEGNWQCVGTGVSEVEVPIGPSWDDLPGGGVTNWRGFLPVVPAMIPLIPLIPQNTQTPCTFNINISGVSDQELTDMQNEITRIFASGNLNVVFGQPGNATGGSMNLTVTSMYTGAAANVLTSQGISANDPRVLGVTVPNSGNAYVNSYNVFRTNPTRFASGSASSGTRLGRVGAHEVIQHGFLGSRPDGPIEDITRPSAAMPLASLNTTRFDISAITAAALRRLCP